MRVFLVVTSEQALDDLIGAGYKNILIAWENKKIIRKVASRNDINLIIDSGAYTAWTKGSEVDLDEYINFSKEIQNNNNLNSLVIVNLDIIPGRFGSVPCKEDIEIASQEGWKNYEKMKGEGLEVMHLFHQHEDIKWLNKLMKEKVDYIGISPANDMSSKARLKWLKGVFSIVKDKKKTHGFGVTDIKILSQIPFFSADSSNWSTLARWGCSGIYDGKLGMRSVKYGKLKDALDMGLDHKALRDNSFLRKEMIKTIKGYLMIEKDITKLWVTRGVKWIR